MYQTILLVTPSLLVNVKVESVLMTVHSVLQVQLSGQSYRPLSYPLQKVPRLTLCLLTRNLTVVVICVLNIFGIRLLLAILVVSAVAVESLGCGIHRATVKMLHVKK